MPEINSFSLHLILSACELLKKVVHLLLWYNNICNVQRNLLPPICSGWYTSHFIIVLVIISRLMHWRVNKNKSRLNKIISSILIQDYGKSTGCSEWSTNWWWLPAPYAGGLCMERDLPHTGTTPNCHGTYGLVMKCFGAHCLIAWSLSIFDVLEYLTVS